METRLRISLMENLLTRHQKTNLAADTKVGTLLGIITTMLAILAALLTHLAEMSPWVVILTALTAVGLLTGLLFLSLSSAPRTSKPSDSLVYFGSIARTNVETYVEQIKTVSEDAFLEDLIRQCHRTAEIATLKYLWIQRAQRAWYVTLLPWLLTVYQLYKR
jgi:hypothetical protein